MRVLRVSRVVGDLARAAAFYRDRLGFCRAGRRRLDPTLARLLGIPGGCARTVALRLGAAEIELVCCGRLGPPYPRGSRSDDLWFQHLAIVVDDMDAAYRSVCRGPVDPISQGGPQTLPPRNGGVAAFKFRDPDGHPLELLHFPPGQGRAVWRNGNGAPKKPCLGIDHSALAVTATRPSLRFYRRLGFRGADRSLNHGDPQSRLDGMADARVCVTGLRPAAASGMGLELLAYHPPGRKRPRVPTNARLTDWTTIVTPGLRGGRQLGDGRSAVALRDPDGHIVLAVDRA